MHTFTRLIRFLFVIVTLLSLPATSASAALMKCRTDPIFHLSNGDQISVTPEIATDPANIRDIHYVLHVPAGVTVQKVTYTNTNLALRETYQVYQTAPARTYTTKTLVTMRTTLKVAVTVMTRLNGLSAKYVSGFTGQQLIVTVSK
jgi:hypothetical protein